MRHLVTLRRRKVLAFLTVLSFAGPLGPPAGLSAAPWQSPDPDSFSLGDQPDGPAGVEVVTRGPLHEAFAEPVVFDPRPGPLVPKEPPRAVEEAPPEQKPDGENVQWIPGYWAWDDTRDDFLWISGLWRDMPPGRQWVPGYWAADSGGFRWVPGAWSAVQQDAQMEYYPTPPQSLEAGPNSPAPAAGATWSPGYWYWYAERYVWRPGFWVVYQPDWVWVPAHYVWTPNGYLFVTGYWDLPVVRRGTCFAPVYFAQPVYAQPRFVYTPTISLVATVLVSSLFVRPACHQYYFGDFYAPEYRTAGIYPWFAYNQTRFGYDPVFAHYSTTIVRRDPAWMGRLQDDYRYRREHPEARPPHTYVEMQRVVNRSLTVNRVTNINVTNVTNVNQNIAQNTRNLVLARPVSQIAANPRIVANARFAPGLADADLPRFSRLDVSRREEVARQTDDLRRFRQQRLEGELQASRERATARLDAAGARVGPGRSVAGRPAAPAIPEQPRRLALSRSPVSAAVTRASAEPRPGPVRRLPQVPDVPNPRDRPERPAGPPVPRRDPVARPANIPGNPAIGQGRPGPAGPGGPQRPAIPPARPAQSLPTRGEAARDLLNRQQEEASRRRQELEQRLEAERARRRQEVESRTPRQAPPPVLPQRRQEGPGPILRPGMTGAGVPGPGPGPANVRPGEAAAAQRQQRFEALQRQRQEELNRRAAPGAAGPPPPGLLQRRQEGPRPIFRPATPGAGAPGPAAGRPNEPLAAQRQQRLEALQRQRQEELKRREEARKAIPPQGLPGR